ncbi:MAG TPA: response regulator [Anaerolineae bacterium]|nr:response regulator [Anaerolineae bacterium]
MNEQPYAKKILLVEDEDQFYTPISRWLSEADYRVRAATTYQEAHSALEAEHFHLAVVDVRLDTNDTENEEGLKLISDMRQMGLTELPCIVLTGHANKKWVLRALQDLGASRFIEKHEGGYRRELLQAVDDLFRTAVNINFDLEYIGDSERIFSEVVEDVTWKTGDKPPLTLLTPQVRDLFGRLFADAERVYLSKLKPGLAGAAVVRAQPTYSTGGMGRSYVVKVGRRDKVETESAQFRKNVRRFLPANTVGQMGAAYSRHLGGLLYSFAETERAILQELDEYYRQAAPGEIIESLRGLFYDTCHNWYEARVRDRRDLPQLYYEALQLEPTKLIRRIQVVLPQLDPQADTFRFSPDAPPVLNPIAWLNKHRDECVLPVYQCITHGDLTGRNVMVDETGKCWLIDFYRTEKGHVLRDFVILETDIKYRLLAGMKTLDFLKLEKALLDADRSGLPPQLGPAAGEDVRKAALVVHELRRMAYEFSKPMPRGNLAEARREHLVSLLMATLNVARLRHVDEGRKIQAMHSAVLICAELDKLAGRQPEQTIFDVYMRQKRSDSLWAPEDSGFFAPALAVATAQQRFLAEQLVAGKVMLFLGTAVPQGVPWPNAHHLAKQLMQEIDYGVGNGEKPAKLFAYYLNKMGDRERLLAKHQTYYENQPRPNFFRRVARLDWRAVYTTNQHCYLEEAYEVRERPYQTLTSLDTAVPESEAVPIYKMHGSLSGDAFDSSPTALPLTEYDYRDRVTRQRVRRFWEQMGEALESGYSLLMLCATEDELDRAYDEYRPSDNAGLIWIAGGDFSEQEQDVYRNLDLRVLPDHPSELLTILYTLLSVEGHLRDDKVRG